MYIIYQTKQRLGLAILSLYLLILAVPLYIVFVKGFSLLVGVFIVVDLFFILNFYQLFFRVTNVGIEFGFGVFKRKIKKELIESVFIDSSLGNFVGVGIIPGRGSWGFIAKQGDGIRIILKNKANFFITVNDTEEVMKLINSSNNYLK